MSEKTNSKTVKLAPDYKRALSTVAGKLKEVTLQVQITLTPMEWTNAQLVAAADNSSIDATLSRFIRSNDEFLSEGSDATHLAEQAA